MIGTRPEISSEVWQLMMASCDGTLDAIQLLELEQHLLNNPAKQRALLDCHCLNANLYFHVASHATETIKTIPTQIHATKFLPELATTETTTTSVALAKPRPLAIYFNSHALAIAVSLLLVGYFVATLSLLFLEHNSDRQPSLAQATIGNSQNSPEAANLAHLEWADNARWLNDQTLFVEQGFAKLKFESGAEVMIEGPAEFETNDKNRGFLRHGKLLASVPKQATGFTIQTPEVDVVDLGTEFAVEVSPTGTAQIEVFKGEVEISTALTNKVILSANQRVQVSHSKVTSVVKKSESFANLKMQQTPAAEIEIVFGDIADDWSSPKVWSDGKPVSPLNHYHVRHGKYNVVRTPLTHNPPSFAGKSLAIHPHAMFLIKHTGELLVHDLQMYGGQIYLGDMLIDQVGIVVGGKMQVIAASSIHLNGGSLTLAMALTGSGDLTLQGAGELLLHTDSQKYQGNWIINNASLVALTFGSLGSGNVTLRPEGKLNVQYNVNSPQAIYTLELGSQLTFSRPLVLGELVVNGQPIAKGVYSLTQLRKFYPGFFAGEETTITITGSAAHAKDKASAAKKISSAT